MIIALQLDLARQKENIEFISDYAHFAKNSGYNTIILYLENVVRTKDTEFFNKEDTYSIDEMKDIIKAIESFGLDVIPAFENLGHLEKWFMYPQFEKYSECENQFIDGRGLTGYLRGDCGCVSNSELYKILDKYISEVAALFNSKYVHMGLDEPFDFGLCEKCVARLERGETKKDLFFKHIMHCYSLVKSMNKTMLMWDDFFEYADVSKEIPKDIILCNWNYFYVDSELRGHWTNRIKRDWFKYYDELGLRYIFCTNAHNFSCTFNVDSFTTYAKKYSPFGALMTAWERSNSFYFGAYPLISYAGQLWDGKFFSNDDKIALYSQILGVNQILASMILSLNFPCFYGAYTDIKNFVENDSLMKYTARVQFSLLIDELNRFLKSNPVNENFMDYYSNVCSCYIMLEVANIGNILFNYRENNCKDSDLLNMIAKKVVFLKEIFSVKKEYMNFLWQKNRLGVESARNDLNNTLNYLEETINSIEEQLSLNTDFGILYLDLMLHEGFCSMRGIIEVKYQGENEFEQIYKGNLKHSESILEIGLCYGFRFKIKNKKIDSIRFSVFGEGCLYPLNFRALIDRKLFMPKAVKNINGMVFNAHRILTNDTLFAEIGEVNGIKHFNDISVSKEIHSVEIVF